MAVARAPRVSAEALAGTTRQRYFIAGMDCPTEEGLLRKQLQGKDGVVALEFDLINRLLDVHHRLPDDAPLRAAIAAAGMSPQAIDTA
ncbi:heavy metal translocating P-type ATPase, partial [Roseateles chitinivorans]